MSDAKKPTTRASMHGARRTSPSPSPAATNAAGSADAGAPAPASSGANDPSSKSPSAGLPASLSVTVTTPFTRANKATSAATQSSGGSTNANANAPRRRGVPSAKVYYAPIGSIAMDVHLARQSAVSSRQSASTLGSARRRHRVDGGPMRASELMRLSSASSLAQSMSLDPSRASSVANFDPNGSFRSTGTASRLDNSPPLPPDSTISAEEVIRESMASVRSTAIYAERDDLMMSSQHSSDSLTFSFSSRSTFRRSTISEEMLHESALFEPERELSLEELSEALQSSTIEPKTLAMTSIKEEEQELKIEHAKKRWAQQVKLCARNLLFPVLGGTKTIQSTPVLAATQQPKKAARVTAATQEWATQQLTKLQQSTPGTAKAQKWNRWMNEYFHGQQGIRECDPSDLISLEEVVNNPRMMRYYAAWLTETADKNQLFFLCSFEEYRQFWCTLRTNSRDLASALTGEHPTSGRAMFSKDDVLMLRTYGAKIATKYLTKEAQFPIGGDLVSPEALRIIKHDILTGGDDALRTFDRIVTCVKRALMEQFPDFRQTDLYAEMRFSVEREVICLEDILMNQRFANFFWVFLFPHNYHREIAFWLDIEYEFKPAYRTYMNVVRTRDHSKEVQEQAARQCRRLLRYIAQKYYPGDESMVNLHKSISSSLGRLQHEQDEILAKFTLIHLELYHRFLTSRAYTEFALYPKNAEDEESMDDLRHLSGLLMSYGLRVHHWPDDASREVLRKRSLDMLQTSRGFDAIHSVVSFDTVEIPGAPGVEVRLTQHPLSHDPTPAAPDRSIECFLLPWCVDIKNPIKLATTCPPPIAFNFKMGDNSTSSGLYGACMVIFKPAPVMTSPNDLIPLDNSQESRWVPYGVCILSKFALVDLLRERLAEAYEFIVEVEAKDVPKSLFTQKNTPGPGTKPFSLDKKLVSKLARSVLFDQSPIQPTPTPAPTIALPRLDHSIRLLFDTLDIATILAVFTAALLESRVLFISTYRSALMRVCESLRALMFPLLWPHVYLPVLPTKMLQCLECPTPFIFGVTKDALSEEAMKELLDEDEDILVVDLDKGCIAHGETPCDLPRTIANDLREGLVECLRPNVGNCDHVFAHRFPAHPFAFPDQAVRLVFAQTVKQLIGEFGFHRYEWIDEFSKKKTVFLDEASYLAASAPETREFRTLFIATQAFSEYVVSFNGFEERISDSKSKGKSKLTRIGVNSGRDNAEQRAAS